MKLLFIAGDYWHSKELLERELTFLKDLGHEIDFVEDAKDIVTMELIRNYDEIVIAKGNALTSANQHPWFEKGTTLLPVSGYEEYVKGGGSLLVLHAGASFSKGDCPEMTDFIGVSFIEHPLQCRVDVTVSLPSHPIAEHLAPFTLSQDEHYFIERTESEGIVVLEGTSHAGTQPACIAREMGKGRMCILTPGHNALVFKTEGFRQALASCIDWTAFKK